MVILSNYLYQQGSSQMHEASTLVTNHCITGIQKAKSFITTLAVQAVDSFLHFKKTILVSNNLFHTRNQWSQSILTTAYPMCRSSDIPTTQADWDVKYDGYGFTLFDEVNGIILQPKASTSSNETHAALAIAKSTEQFPLRDFKATIIVTTEQQLRVPTPNAWECFWFFFNYTLDEHGKKVSNYFTLKPNGIEIGTAYDEVGQRFLATDFNPTLTIGVPNEIVITKRGQWIQVMIDGNVVMDYDGTDLPEKLFNIPGSIGLYTEDARVHIHTVSIERS